MATSMLKKVSVVISRFSLSDQIILQQIRTAYATNRKILPQQGSQSWNRLKKELTQKHFGPSEPPANIGLPFKESSLKLSRADLRKMKLERDNDELEKKARQRELVTPMNEIINQTFEGAGQKHIHRLAEHHGIYRDLFGDSFFYPSVHLKVGYTDLEDSEMIQPVYYGNLMAPGEVRSCPEVFYKSNEGKFYTLCLVAPDSHLKENNQEYLHWMVTNIPGNAVDQGDVLYKYMPVFPVHGTGTHRYVFLLYQHDARLDLSVKPETTDSPNLNERTFNTQQFYINHMSSITPVGLCFYQAEWDRSVRDTFHKVLDMEEPRFEFLPPSEYIPKQKIWPEWESFNKYMDTYRDKKEIGEQVLKEKLKTGHPFKPRSPRPRYPLIFKPKGKMATWLLIQEHEKRLRKSYWKALDD